MLGELLKNIQGATFSLGNFLKESFNKPEVVQAQVAAVPVAVEPVKPQVTKEMLKFQDSSPGFRGMSYVENEGKTTFLDEFNYTPPKVKQPIKRIEISDPRDATAPDTAKQGTVIEDPERLALANTIKAVADEVAPEYTDYLLRLAWYEGRYGSKTENKNSNGKGVDRGVFQINTEAFPDVPDEFAQDPVKATLWAISVIESGKQDKWVADQYVKKAKTKISY